MAGAKNRRQGAATASPEAKGQDRDITQGANGNGSAHIPEATHDEPQENIFLLWPNIIGTHHERQHSHHIAC
jgi:CDP-diacylglycerol--inositol 3-phosphatidyltransferase